MYKTFVIDYHPKAEAMAQAIEEKVNTLEQDGYEVVSVTVTPSAKGIVLAKKVDGEGKVS